MGTVPQSDKHKVALAVAKVGWPVFPGQARGKVPRFRRAHEDDPDLQRTCKGKCGNVGHGFYDATTDVDRINGSRAAHNFDLISIPYNCHDGSSQRVNILNTADALPVIHRHFEGRLQHADTVLKIDGDLRSGGRARGNMSWNVNDGTEAGTCYSGLLSWSATR